MATRSSDSAGLERLVIAALRAAMEAEKWVAADHLLAALEALASDPEDSSGLDRAYREVSTLLRPK